MKKLFLLSFFISCIIQGSFSQITLITDGSWKGVGNSVQAGGNAWLYPGYDDSAWPQVEAPNVANVIPVVPGSQSIWVLPYSDTAKMRMTFVVPVADSYSGSISINADNEFELYFNAVSQGFYNDWMGGPYVFNISPVLQGCVQNVVAINAANWGGPYGASLSTTLNVTNPLNTPVALEETNVTCSSFTARWDSVPTADLYFLDVSTDPNFLTYYSVYHDFNVNNVLSYPLGSLPAGGIFYYRLRCQRTNGLGTLISCYSNTITVNLSDPTVTYTAPDTVCAGEDITLHLSGPAGGTLNWSGPGGFTSVDTLEIIPNSTGTNTGTYSYTITYPGCSPITGNFHIEVIDLPALILTSSSPYCSTGPLDTLGASVAGVQWSGAGITNASAGYFSPAVAGTGTHLLTAIRPGTCPDTAQVNVVVNLDAGYTLSGSDSICAGQSLVLQSTSGAGATIQWIGPGGFNSSSANVSIPSATGANSGNYVLTVSYPACPAHVDTLSVIVKEYPIIDFLPIGPFCSTDADVDLAVNPLGGAWSGTGIIASSGTFSPTVSGTGTFTLTYSVGGLCPASDSLSVQVMNNVPLASVIFPNVFTPNDDGVNELYAPIVPAGGHYKLTIFDRWGVLVFEDNGTDKAWDGKIGASSASAGIYYWICEINSDCNPQPQVEKGFVQLF